jgi:hypothetical protein
MSPTSTLDSDSEDDAIVDHIDEQEIYGMPAPLPEIAPTNQYLSFVAVDTRRGDEFFIVGMPRFWLR